MNVTPPQRSRRRSAHASFQLYEKRYKNPEKPESINAMESLVSACVILFHLLRFSFYCVLPVFKFLARIVRRKPLPKPDFNADIVLVTGAAQGLGRAIALRFADCGATVVLWDINERKVCQGKKGIIDCVWYSLYTCSEPDTRSVRSTFSVAWCVLRLVWSACCMYLTFVSGSLLCSCILVQLVFVYLSSWFLYTASGACICLWVHVTSWWWTY